MFDSALNTHPFTDYVRSTCMLKRFRFLLHGLIVAVTLMVILSSLDDFVRLAVVIALIAMAWLIEQNAEER